MHVKQYKFGPITELRCDREKIKTKVIELEPITQNVLQNSVKISLSQPRDAL